MKPWIYRTLLRQTYPALLAAALPLASGCAEKHHFEPVFPVSGAVFVAGKPAVGAMVTFHPAADFENPRARRSFAMVTSDGKFALSTYYPADGVPVGEYVVTINWPSDLPPDAHPTTVPADRLRGRYSSPAKPFTTVTVKEEPNLLPPFEISG